jgi:hypothetical protein
MNTSKIVVGGLAAGVVMSILGYAFFALWLGPQMNAQMDAVVPGLSGKMATTTGMVLNIASNFAVGILIAWLYAAMRPRFGAGFKTAAYAALPVWVCGFVFYQGWYVGGMMTGTTYITVAVVQAVMLLAAAYVAGMLYKEGTASAPAMASARP